MLSCGYLALKSSAGDILVSNWSWRKHMLPSFDWTYPRFRAEGTCSYWWPHSKNGNPQTSIGSHLSSLWIHTHPLAWNLAICFFSSTSSFIGILYGLLKISRVLGNNSMMNSMSRWSGIPGNSSGKTSGNSQTILISTRDVPLTSLSTLNWLAKIAAGNSTLVPSSWVKQITLLAHQITPSYFLNQSMPRIISMP
jgi:hypothetical protein